MSTLRRRTNGYFFIDIRTDGARKRISLDTKDRRTAKAKANIIERDLTGGEPISRATLDDFKLEFELYSKARKAPSTTKAERYALNKLSKFIRMRYLDQITPKMADAFVTAIAREKKKDKTLTPGAVNFYIRTLKAIFTTAHKWGYVDRNPFVGVKAIRFERSMPRILTLGEIASVFEAAKRIEPAMAPLIEFYLLTGMRRNEALNLEWRDVDLARNVLILRNTKGKRARTVPMAPRVKTILDGRRELARPFLFRPSTVSHKFTLIAREAGIGDVSLHDLRRSFTSYAQDIGMPAMFLPWLIGHTEEQTTQQHYTGFYDEMIAQYFVKLQAKIFPN